MNWVSEEHVRIDDVEIDSLVAELGMSDGVVRWNARQRLVQIGRPAVPALIQALASADEGARWEAAKALGEIRDPQAAPALVDALEDWAPGVRWLAAKGLIALGNGALPALLQAVERCADSLWLRAGVEQVLHDLIQDQDGLADEAFPVLEALRGVEPGVEAPVAAYRVLASWQQGTGG